MEEYNKQGEKFLKETKTEFKAEFLKNDIHFIGDREKRDIYLITLKRGEREFKFNFGQSIDKSLNPEYRKKIKHLKSIINKNFPTAYDVLSIVTKYEVGSFENFCDAFGYNDDSIKAKGIYKAVLNEYNNIKWLFSDAEIEKLQEIE